MPLSNSLGDFPGGRYNSLASFAEMVSNGDNTASLADAAMPDPLSLHYPLKAGYAVPSTNVYQGTGFILFRTGYQSKRAIIPPQ